MTRSFAPALLIAALATSPALGQEGERITVEGEIIDTWCYFSGVMGGPEAVVGTAHHTCALWCSAGGIPVGLLTAEGDVYMVLKLPGTDRLAGGDTALKLASHSVTAEGMHYSRDGLDYIIVEEVVADAGITNLNHEDYGVVPGFAIPDDALEP
ncbi:hypothetical protein OCH239_20010 [Roseivivax halodurans JCM 10272]|uniref:Uncharacterized protein n=1 Tax=Roseivivax halodurans JCM 10272 TaxID=1449350 RepID=X7E6H6_9RHOB|nr:hypothetical protein [Roseivivax halodurans]ETX11674.1 hypothetical protein OCH239_20010 [Roseivivax halodurans JCM 10272]